MVVSLVMIYLVLKLRVSDPILLLTKFIMEPEVNDAKKLESFIDVILKKAEWKQRKLESLSRR